VQFRVAQYQQTLTALFGAGEMNLRANLPAIRQMIAAIKGVVLPLTQDGDTLPVVSGTHDLRTRLSAIFTLADRLLELIEAAASLGAGGGQ
jgi:hypothetical protein